MPRPLASARPARRWATLQEAEAYSGVQTWTLRRWISRGLLPGYRIGPRAIRIDLDDLDKLVRQIPSAGRPARRGRAS